MSKDVPDFSGVKGGSSKAPGKAPDSSKVQGGSSSTAEKLHVVLSGDSLSKIAKKHYGHAALWTRVFEANRDVIRDPDNIFPGQKLRIPK